MQLKRKGVTVCMYMMAPRLRNALKNYFRIVPQHTKEKTWFFLCSQSLALSVLDFGDLSMGRSDTPGYSDYP